MGTEIERKFLPYLNDWRQLIQSSSLIKQGYIAREGGNIVRIRLEEGLDFKKATVCIKGTPLHGATPEFEYEASLGDGETLFQLCENRILTKRRYLVPHEHHLFEIDEFLGTLLPLVIIEVELTENQEIILPNWVGTEVSNDRRYTNASLVDCGIPR